MTMKFNLVFSLTMGLFVLGTFAAPEKSRSEIFDDDFPEEVHDTKIKFAEISARIRTDLESVNRKIVNLLVEKFIEKYEDFKVETAETSEPEFEAVEKIIEPELKAEDETFEETKKLDKFYGFEQADLVEYEADLEAESKAGKPEEKIWQTTEDIHNPFL